VPAEQTAVRTRVIASRGRYDWPDYTNRALYTPGLGLSTTVASDSERE